MISYLYIESYIDQLKALSSTSTSSSSAATTYHPLMLNAKVYVMAEKYDVSRLKTYSAQKFEDSFPGTWNATLMAANSPPLAASLKLLYEEPPESDRHLKGIALKFISE